MKEFLTLLLHFKKDELFLQPTQNGFIQFFRFIFVGGIATVVDIAVATVTYEWMGLKAARLSFFGFDGGLLIANALGFLLGLAVNYCLSILWIFRNENINRLKEFLSFTLIGLAGLGIKLLVVAVLERYVFNMETVILGILPMVTLVSIIATLAAFIWNFAARKFILYNQKNMERLRK